VTKINTEAKQMMIHPLANVNEKPDMPEPVFQLNEEPGKLEEFNPQLQPEEKAANALIVTVPPNVVDKIVQINQSKPLNQEEAYSEDSVPEIRLTDEEVLREFDKRLKEFLKYVLSDSGIHGIELKHIRNQTFVIMVSPDDISKVKQFLESMDIDDTDLGNKFGINPFYLAVVTHYYE